MPPTLISRPIYTARRARAALTPGEIEEQRTMMRSTFRGVLGLVLVAAATWLANYLTERIFGPEDATPTASGVLRPS